MTSTPLSAERMAELRETLRRIKLAATCESLTETGYENALEQVRLLASSPTLPDVAGAGEQLDGSRALPFDRDELGRMVREAWVRWAQAQPNPKPSWLVPYAELPEPDKEADRQIGEAVARWTLIGDSANRLTSAHLSGVREAAKVFTQKADAWDASASMSSTSAGIQQRAIACALRAAVFDLRALPDPPAGETT